MTKLDRIREILKEPLSEKGYEILQLRYLKHDRRSKLEFLLERLDEGAVTIEDCTRASRLISALLDVEDPISEAYILEVSSPGLDRPLVRMRDYERFQGNSVKVELTEAFEEKKRFKGVIARIVGEEITFVLEEEPVKEMTVRFEEIYHCKLLPVL